MYFQPRRAKFYADPEFHGNHGKVPCHSYIILEEHAQGSVIKGNFPNNIQEYIQNLRTYDNRLETDMDAVQVLNILGFNGYRVVGTANNMSNRLTWTLERGYF